MALQIKLLQTGDEGILANVAPGVFDHEIDPALTRQFLADPGHHLAVAIDDSVVVGFASAVHYVHPDKPPELWINEVAVAASQRKAGIGKALLSALFEAGRKLGCGQAWVLTERPNVPAMRLYASMGGEESAIPPVMFSFSLEDEK